MYLVNTSKTKTHNISQEFQKDKWLEEDPGFQFIPQANAGADFQAAIWKG